MSHTTAGKKMKKQTIGKVNVYHGDCMEFMRDLPDNHYDLAIVDPPYGIEKAFQATSRIAKYGQVQTVNDLKPSEDFF